MNFQLENIKTILAGKLPGELSHKKMLPPERQLTFTDEEKNIIKKSSVLFLLFQEKDELFVCLIKRPAHMKYHPGQIALPGGKVEKGETVLETAFRETYEEIGIKAKQINILGSLSELYVSISSFLIHPFVGWLEKKPRFNLNKDEVDKIILFPLLKYKNAFEATELKTISGKLKVPCIHFENEIIWGATGMILSEFYDLLDNLEENN